MSKHSKLTEKAVRIPDSRGTRWAEAISRYLHDVEPLNKEQARSHRFSMLLQELLGFEPSFIENFTSGIEQSLKIKEKDQIVRGETDNLFGNVIIEFEVNIPKKRSEAEEQLRRYVSILWSQEKIISRTPFLCIATDGVRFITYSSLLLNTESQSVLHDQVSLQVLEETDWLVCKPDDIFYWLDRYFLRKEVLHPTSESIVKDFGMKSHAFQITSSALQSLWINVKLESSFAVIYDSWEKYLHIVYGSQIAGDNLFIRHTYLATLAKLMSWSRISESAQLPDNTQIIDMLEGRLFKAHGIENFIEEDFFSWLARPDAQQVSINVVRWLFSLLKNYNLRELSEDVLKSLYQELVDPETRHDLGEFYTPDWLAHRIVNKLLDSNPHGAVFDPACGSGTFLYLTIREKRVRLGNSPGNLQHIIESVYGSDIHPLAVIVAKTNYILALGDLLKKRKGTISIPVYLADTLRLPEKEIKPKLWMQLPSYRINLDGRDVYLPEMLLQNPGLYDQAIELAKEFARQYKNKSITSESFNNFLQAQHFPEAGNQQIVQALYSIAETLKHFIEINRDSIWAFILKNTYKPLFFKGKFDFIIGNPPWIAFRFMEPSYQAFLKRQIAEEYKLLLGRGELITHLEVATLFLVRAADLYLKSGGVIAFVLPKSLFSGDQHDGLRKRSFKFSEDSLQNLFWQEIWDCESVTPLFNVPSCVVIAEKNETKPVHYPVNGQIVKGKLERKNAALEESEQTLTVENVSFNLHKRGKRSFWSTGKTTDTTEPSYYKKYFSQGATIVSRSFWFVQVKHSPLGINPALPLLETDARARAEAKDAYKTVYLTDTVESRFIYATLLSADLLPFGHFGYRLVVLPIEPDGEQYKLVDVEQARKRGFLHLARWLEAAQVEWENRRTTKAKRITVLNWLDYRRKLTNQNPNMKYRVIYNTSGTFLTAAVVANEAIEIPVDTQKITAQGFVSDTKTYYYETNSKITAYYLVAALNAPVIDELVKPLQSRGQWGPRDIHKKIFDATNLPRYDAAKSSHKRLAELGELCSNKVEQWIAQGGQGKIQSIGKMRGMIRTMLGKELQEIDKLVISILGK